jgi:hypothetical protein
MGWRDGCAPRPPVADGAEAVDFDFGGADQVGPRLEALRDHVSSGLGARAAAQIHLRDWSGGHRREYDDHRGTQEGILSGADIGTELARLRAAWDEAARAQLRANRAVEAATGPSGRW